MRLDGDCRPPLHARSSFTKLRTVYAHVAVSPSSDVRDLLWDWPVRELVLEKRRWPLVHLFGCRTLESLTVGRKASFPSFTSFNSIPT